jgi:hypothetical protein
MISRKIGSVDVDWVCLFQDRGHWWMYTCEHGNSKVPLKTGSILAG